MTLAIDCGQRQTPGYIHNDIDPLPGVDLIHDGFPGVVRVRTSWGTLNPDRCLCGPVASGIRDTAQVERCRPL